MSLPPIFSRRKRQAAGPVDDVYVYDVVPPRVRIQVLHVIEEAVGSYDQGNYAFSASTVYDEVVRIMRKEMGVFSLTNGYSRNSQDEFSDWLTNEQDTERVLDAIELAFWMIDGHVRRGYAHFRTWTQTSPDDAIAEVNARLQEAAIGYEFDSGKLIQINSKIVHDSVVVPALHLLSDTAFSTANTEYLDAHSAFRQGDYDASIVECGKAFESVLKIIGDARGWPIKPTDPAKRLLTVAFEADFIPSFMQTEFSGLRSLLEGGVPVVRNKMGGHGAGSEERNVPKHLAAFQLHQTAAAIVFLVEHHKTLPR